MKVMLLALLVILFPSLGVAASTSYFKADNVHLCHRYTDNEIDEEELTDHPQQVADTEITVTAKGYLVKKGAIFPEDQFLSFDPTGRYYRVGYNSAMVMAHKEARPGKAYFIFYFFKRPGMKLNDLDPRENVSRVVVVADCDH